MPYHNDEKAAYHLDRMIRRNFYEAEANPDICNSDSICYDVNNVGGSPEWDLRQHHPEGARGSHSSN